MDIHYYLLALNSSSFRGYSGMPGYRISDCLLYSNSITSDSYHLAFLNHGAVLGKPVDQNGLDEILDQRHRANEPLADAMGADR